MGIFGGASTWRFPRGRVSHRLSCFFVFFFFFFFLSPSVSVHFFLFPRFIFIPLFPSRFVSFSSVRVCVCVSLSTPSHFSTLSFFLFSLNIYCFSISFSPSPLIPPSLRTYFPSHILERLLKQHAYRPCLYACPKQSRSPGFGSEATERNKSFLKLLHNEVR